MPEHFRSTHQKTSPDLRQTHVKWDLTPGSVVEPRFHDGLGPPAGGLGPSQSVQHPETDPVTSSYVEQNQRHCAESHRITIIQKTQKTEA